MRSKHETIETGGKKISGEWNRVEDPRGIVLLAHGAGARRDHPSMTGLAESLEQADFTVFRFNFPYAESGRKVPDRAPTLVQCWNDVLHWVRQQPDTKGSPLVVGGRSMGGRMASMAAAEAEGGFRPDGLALFAYPLHPPGRTDSLRAGHLASIGVPVLFLSGTRDTMARRDLLEEEVQKLGDRARVHWIDGADHGFHVLKRSGRTDEDVRGEAINAFVDWYNKKVSGS